jgi:dTDP-4-amino-4,6-dideoxygalactose transaminase
MNRKDVYFSRVRPYVNNVYLRFLLKEKEQSTKQAEYGIRYPTKNKFFFSDGRGSLKWLLQILRRLSKKPLKIGLQAFTCQVVPQAILESGNHPVFFDISPEFYTTLIGDLAFEQIDILILTHLFGIPNPDYFRICEICKRKKIFLIDDLAMTFKSSVCMKEIGYESDAAFYSFGFDKPISCYKGGLLRLNNEGLADELQRYFNNLSQETPKRQINDLMKLQVSYELFEKNEYLLGASYEIEDYLLPIINVMQLDRIKTFRKSLLLKKFFCGLNKLFSYKVRGKNSSIDLVRMGKLKLDYLNTLWDLYPDVHRTRLSAADKAKRKIFSLFKGVSFPKLAGNIQPSWHRLPILAPKNQKIEIIEWGKRNGIEIGQYNWSILCFEPFRELSHLNPEKFPRSNLVKKQILNLPIWAEEIWEF